MENSPKCSPRAMEEEQYCSSKLRSTSKRQTPSRAKSAKNALLIKSLVYLATKSPPPARVLKSESLGSSRLAQSNQRLFNRR